MIPTGGIGNGVVREIQQPSHTWRLDFHKGQITGKTDELEALRQAIFMILQTDRFRYLIFSPNYGHEIHSLIGHSPAYLRMELARRINEALTQDDRIERIDHLTIDIEGDRAIARFTVVTTFGNLNFIQEVR